MANTVRGKNIICSMLIGVDYVPIFCGKSAEFTLNQEEIETTSINSGSFREFIPGMTDGTFTINGVTTSDNTNGRVSINYLLQQSVRRTIRSIKIVMTDDNGNNQVISFNAIIVNSGFNRDIPSYSQSSVSFRITGSITLATIAAPTETVQDPIYKTTTPGLFSVTDALLTGATILEVQREGLGYTQTSGTPTGRQFNFTGTTITFDSSIPFNTGEIVYILYKL